MVARARVPGSANVTSLQVSPDGGTLYALQGDATLSALDPTTLGARATAKITSGGFSLQVLNTAITPDGSRLLLASRFPSVVTAVSTTTLRVVTEWPIQGSPRAIAINPQGTRAYVASYDITTIDLTTGDVIGRLDLPRPLAAAAQDNVRRQQVIGVAVTPDGRTLVATTTGGWTYRIAVTP
jgi:DNA-binding beta-propeller fold protein YncE